MKKMLLPILAVILAVGFSAFTMPKHLTGKTTMIQYPYWYETTDQVHVASILYANTGNPLAQDELESNDVDVPCDFSSGELCTRGSNIPKSVGDPLPASAPDSDIQKSTR